MIIFRNFDDVLWIVSIFCAFVLFFLRERGLGVFFFLFGELGSSERGRGFELGSEDGGGFY